jgi:hypothetical protein
MKKTCQQLHENEAQLNEYSRAATGATRWLKLCEQVNLVVGGGRVATFRGSAVSAHVNHHLLGNVLVQIKHCS